jgi:hypothetical protein
MKFELGELVVTRNIFNNMTESDDFAQEIKKVLNRYVKADFSDMESKDDIKMNEDAIKNGDDRIFAIYQTSKGKIYIITEWDRSVTTILYPSEY